MIGEPQSDADRRSPWEVKLVRALSPDYELGEIAAHGARGTVFRGLCADGRVVAIKALAEDLQRNPDSRRQFRTVAEASAPLDHPGIVRTLEIVEKGEVLVQIMPFVQGADAAESLSALSGPAPLPWCCRLGRQVADALGHARDLGRPHGDLTPRRILIERETGRARILGFGNSFCDDQGQLLRNPRYMAPELLEKAARSASPSADMFSLGAILYEILTGLYPFPSRTAVELLLYTRAGKLEPLGDLRDDAGTVLSELVHRMLDPDERARPDSSEVSRALENA